MTDQPSHANDARDANVQQPSHSPDLNLVSLAKDASPTKPPATSAYASPGAINFTPLASYDDHTTAQDNASLLKTPDSSQRLDYNINDIASKNVSPNSTQFAANDSKSSTNSSTYLPNLEIVSNSNEVKAGQNPQEAGNSANLKGDAPNTNPRDANSAIDSSDTSSDTSNKNSADNSATTSSKTGTDNGISTNSKNSTDNTNSDKRSTSATDNNNVTDNGAAPQSTDLEKTLDAYLADPANRQQNFNYSDLLGNNRVITLADDNHSGTGAKDEVTNHLDQLQKAGVTDLALEPLTNTPATQKLLDDYKAQRTPEQKNQLELQIASGFGSNVSKISDLQPGDQATVNKLMNMIDKADDLGMNVHGVDPPGANPSVANPDDAHAVDDPRIANDVKDYFNSTDPATVKNASTAIDSCLKQNTTSPDSSAQLENWMQTLKNNGFHYDQDFGHSFNNYRDNSWLNSIQNSLNNPGNPDPKVAVFAGSGHFGQDGTYSNRVITDSINDLLKSKDNIDSTSVQFTGSNEAQKTDSNPTGVTSDDYKAANDDHLQDQRFLYSYPDNGYDYTVHLPNRQS